MNKLHAFGDSFTWGSELGDAIDANLPRNVVRHKKRMKDIHSPFFEIPYYSLKSWGALYSTHNGMDYKCHANPGNSNNTIFRSFLDELHNISNNDIVILNWTWISRWDVFDLNDSEWQTMSPTSNSGFESMYFKYFQSELWDKLESLKVIALTHHILKKNNIKFISTCIDALLLDSTFHCPTYIEELQKSINDDIIWFENKGFLEWAKTNNYDIGENGHPLEDAHIAAFNYIKDNHEFT